MTAFILFILSLVLVHFFIEPKPDSKKTFKKRAAFLLKSFFYLGGLAALLVAIVAGHLGLILMIISGIYIFNLMNKSDPYYKILNNK